MIIRLVLVFVCVCVCRAPLRNWIIEFVLKTRSICTVVWAAFNRTVPLQRSNVNGFATQRFRSKVHFSVYFTTQVSWPLIFRA
jgi:hypothetical protein